jgi:hypothetical protein
VVDPSRPDEALASILLSDAKLDDLLLRAAAQATPGLKGTALQVRVTLRAELEKLPDLHRALVLGRAAGLAWDEIGRQVRARGYRMPAARMTREANDARELLRAAAAREGARG